jgi:hypothetical protein
MGVLNLPVQGWNMQNEFIGPTKNYLILLQKIRMPYEIKTKILEIILF